MKKITLLIFCFYSLFSLGQIKLNFEYDNAGNQIRRSVCSGCRLASNQKVTDIANLTNKDMIKDFPEDLISYYPNPVKEELYLKWELKDNNKITEIHIYNLSGQLLKSIQKLENQSTQAIAFQEYPQGNYVLLLLYSNGEQKSLKIIKQ